MDAAFDHAFALQIVGQDLRRLIEAYPDTRAKGEALCDMSREIRRAREALDRFEALVAKESREVREATFTASFSSGRAA